MKSTYKDKWFIVQIKPNSADKAERNLKQQGLKTFFPTLNVTSRNSKRFVNKTMPLFPGYMFVAFNPIEMIWSKINNTYGVSRILTFNGKPEEVPFDLILAIKTKYDQNNKFLHSDSLKKGEKLKIIEGPFSGFIGTIDNVDSNKRAWVLLTLMGKKQRFQLKQENQLNYEKL